MRDSSRRTSSEDDEAREAYESRLSLADIERHRSHPVRWTVYLSGVLVAIIGPYWLGRSLAVHETAWLVGRMETFTPQGIAFVSWVVTATALTGLGMAVIESSRWFWRIVFLVGLAAEQLIAGASLLRFDFWYSTYVVYGRYSPLANAANMGIIAAGGAAAAFAVVFVGLLVLIRRDSPLNVLTRSWAAFLLFAVIQGLALAVVLCSGLLTDV
ncbi:hypothetical protein [uncultured Bifidobacterium sp.]|uniref:hypothetical protein n=1 Tax=uncultured Bifidobacterium sp. TaxID=165187 RepID=UPI0028DCF3A3|nr:hypothetical protein [uncultured Bifidobacterium sp.]